MSKKAVSKTKTLSGGTTFSKVHRLKKVAIVHANKVKERGGTATLKPVNGGYKITYTFDKN